MDCSKVYLRGGKVLKRDESIFNDREENGTKNNKSFKKEAS